MVIFTLKQVLTFMDDIFDTLLKALSDPSDEVIFFLLMISYFCVCLIEALLSSYLWSSLDFLQKLL